MKYLKTFRLFESFADLKFINGIHICFNHTSQNAINKSDRIRFTNNDLLKIQQIVDNTSPKAKIEMFNLNYGSNIESITITDHMFYIVMDKYDDEYYRLGINCGSINFGVLIDQLDPLVDIIKTCLSGNVYQFINNLVSGQKLNESITDLKFIKGVYKVDNETDLYGNINPKQDVTEGDRNFVKRIFDDVDIKYDMSPSNNDSIIVFFSISDKSNEPYDSKKTDGYILLSKMEDDYYLVNLLTRDYREVYVIDQLTPLKDILIAVKPP